MDEDMLQQLVELTQTDPDYEYIFCGGLIQLDLAKSSATGALKALEKKPIDLEELKHNLLATRVGHAGLDAFFGHCLAPKFFAGSPTPTSSRLARKIFDISEVCEHIFSFLDIESLLKVQQVDKTMRDVVESSQKLQRQLFLQVDKDGPFHNPKLPLGAAIYSNITTKSDWLSGISYGVSINISMSKQLQLGTKVRKIQLCQPPIKSVVAMTSCCDWNVVGSPNRTLHMDGGVTLGDIIDATKKISADHRLCPWAPASHHDENGEVILGVDFEGNVQIKDDDPKVRELPDEEAEHWKKYGRMEIYAKAKRTAADHGRPIPTLAEYEASLKEGW